MKQIYQIFSTLFFLGIFAGCTLFSSQETGTLQQSREISSLTETDSSGNKTVIKVVEENTKTGRQIKVQIIRGGKIQESIYNLEDPNFDIAIPISDRIVPQTVEQAERAPDARIVAFSQKLQLARESMLDTDYVSALASVNDALRIDENNPQAHSMRGSIYYAMGKNDLAQEEFDRVMQLDPDNEEVKQFLQYLEAKSSDETN